MRPKRSMAKGPKPWRRDGLVMVSPTGRSAKLTIPIWWHDAIEVNVHPIPGYPEFWVHSDPFRSKGWVVSHRSGGFVRGTPWGTTKESLLASLTQPSEG